ncbi:putative plant self-incompatibility S1 [Lupinus albus]|uniref:S-protein homolog n=1 Tax=Lupinus albus TaxID=3870 RepID=A0A6A4PHB9_LUPAL|nr:putative plant self-incompatibility S1 [Lupinus albus]
MVISSTHILFVYLLLLSPLVVVSHWWPILTYRHVYIRNDLGNGTLLTVHCKSKDEDLGVHKLHYKKEFKFQFRPNIWGTTLYFCHLTWHGKSHRIDAFDNDRDIFFCKDLKWSVKKHQTCLFNCDTQKYVNCDHHNY